MERGDGDFSPEWVFEGPSRVTPVVPLPWSSRDGEHYRRVLDARVYYRLVLGQPNPDELVQVLMASLSPELARSVMDDLRIDLRPRPRPVRGRSR